uniref:Uncharacterized protein n=1 Tax=Setaria italica TaxID=4555 RepID=K3YF38_SETIT
MMTFWLFNNSLVKDISLSFSIKDYDVYLSTYVVVRYQALISGAQA